MALRDSAPCAFPTGWRSASRFLPPRGCCAAAATVRHAWLALHTPPVSPSDVRWARILDILTTMSRRLAANCRQLYRRRNDELSGIIWPENACIQAGTNDRSADKTSHNECRLMRFGGQ